MFHRTSIFFGIGRLAARRCLGIALVAGLLQFSIAAPPTIATTQVALFRGFLAGSNSGMDILNATLATAGIPDYLGRVFAWDRRQDAFNWIQQHQATRTTLVLVGHSFGGNSALQLAANFLDSVGTRVDLTIQVDSVENFYQGNNTQLPSNVDVGINYYQISTGFLEPQGTSFVQGAANFNTEVLFNDTSITHTSIDNDIRLYALIVQNILDNLNTPSADFDNDGDVDGTDFLVWQRGESPRRLSAADLELWQTQYGTIPLEAVATVPEPSVMILFGGIAILAVCGRHFVPRAATINR